MEYDRIKTLDGKDSPSTPPKDAAILCVTGIACPEAYISHLENYTQNITHLKYPDHHNFRKSDIAQIEKTFNELKRGKKYIFTTEKDAVRLISCELPEKLKQHIYYIPIVPVFMNQENLLLNELSDYVRKNQK